MKYCAKCGTELLDEAVICTKCGCMAGASMIGNVKREPRLADSRSAPMSLLIVNFICSMFVILSCLWFGITFIASSYIVGYTVSNHIEGWVYFGMKSAIFSVILSAIAFLFSVISFILTLAKRLRAEAVFSAITKVVLSIVLLVIGFLLVVNGQYV